MWYNFCAIALGGEAEDDSILVDRIEWTVVSASGGTLLAHATKPHLVAVPHDLLTVAEGGTMHFCTTAVVDAKIDAHTARVAMWRAVDPATFRAEPTVREQRMPIDLAIAAEMVLDNGATDDIDEIKRRTDVTLRRVSGVDLRSEPR